MNWQGLFQSLEANFPGSAVRQSLWMFPVIECVHLLALALLGGSVLVLNLRLLGFGLRSQPIPDLARKVHPWLVGALVAIIGTGIPMFLSEAIKCYFSPPFWFKMGFLLLSILFTFTIQRKVAYAESGKFAPAVLRLTGAVSLALWFGVGFSGRWIAFY